MKFNLDEIKLKKFVQKDHFSFSKIFTFKSKIDLAAITQNQRTNNIRKHIFLSFFLKFLGMALGFIVIPKTLSILGSDQYGIWLTILSVVSWIVTFDVGIGNGLRNKLSESLAAGNYEDSCKYISTAYVSLAVIGGIIIIGTSVIFPFIDWNQVFNTNLISNSDLNQTMYMITIAVIINFVIIIVNQVMNAFQQSAYTNFVAIFHSGIFLISLISFNTIQDLFTVTKFYSISLIFSSMLVSVLFYSKRKEYIPNIKWLDYSKIKELLKLGGGFFIIQIATLFMFSITSFLIIQFLSLEDVSIYNITFRLFSVVTIIFAIIVTPYWSAFTEAKNKLDFKWIKKSIFNLHIILLLVTLISLGLFFFYQSILDLWLGKNVIVPGWKVVLMMIIYTFVLNWSNIYSHYLNGIGQIRIQTIIAVIQAALVIPLCWFFTEYLQLGLFGVMLGLTVCMLPFAIVGPIITFRNIKLHSDE